MGHLSRVQALMLERDLAVFAVALSCAHQSCDIGSLACVVHRIALPSAHDVAVLRVLRMALFILNHSADASDGLPWAGDLSHADWAVDTADPLSASAESSSRPVPVYRR